MVYPYTQRIESTTHYKNQTKGKRGHKYVSKH